MADNNFTEKDLIDVLFDKFLHSTVVKEIINNVYIFGWESDFFIQRKDGLSIEFEIKTNRADFLNDAKKEKRNRILEHGCIIKNGDGEFSPPVVVEKPRPNQFYYFVPIGLVALVEIPSYAGLMYYSGWTPDCPKIIHVKAAPMLHNYAIDLEEIMEKKYFLKWQNEKREAERLRRVIEKNNELITKQ